ncbi:MAG: amino acid ABC transporter substrate-binding protein [Gammaproteobacteria bacterium]|nr:amino acid ABC transporter substrate-binding protein [Gammaproteobacteria bacterium]
MAKKSFNLIFFIVLLMNSSLLPAQAEVLVGASVALTGKYSRTGQEQLNGYNMWVEEINARGGLLGQQIHMVHYDDESKPGTGAKLYEKLISDDKVNLLLGPYSSGVTMAASTVAEKHAFPMVSTGAASSKIWARGYKNVFGLYTPAEIYMDQILEFAQAKGLKKVALIYADTAFPRAVAKGVKQKVKALGMEVVFDEEYGKGSTDFASMMIKIKVKKPDVVIGGSYLPDSVAFMRQAKEYRVSVQIFAFAVGPGLPDFGKNLGPDAQGVMGNTQWEATLNIPGAREFAERYKKKFGHVPGYHAAGGYGAGQVLEAAVTKAGSLDRDKLRKTLLNMDTATVFGRYRVDETGKQMGKPAYAIQWRDGERHIILPKEAATQAPAYPFKPWDER